MKIRLLYFVTDQLDIVACMMFMVYCKMHHETNNCTLLIMYKIMVICIWMNAVNWVKNGLWVHDGQQHVLMEQAHYANPRLEF